MDIVFATASTTVMTDLGAPVEIIFGTHWPADDPIVKRYPSCFSVDPKYGLYATVPPGVGVGSTVDPTVKRRGRGVQ